MFSIIIHIMEIEVVGLTLESTRECRCWWHDFVLKTQFLYHYSDVIVSKMASQITGVSIVCLSVCSDADQRKHQSSAPHHWLLWEESTGDQQRNVYCLMKWAARDHANVFMNAETSRLLRVSKISQCCLSMLVLSSSMIVPLNKHCQLRHSI